VYKKFFGLRANPFSVSPDPRYLFLTRHMQEALDCLTYGIQSRKGFILLSGEVGTGKTTLINKLLELLHEQQVPSAFVFNSRLDVPTFLSYMMQDFGIPCDAKTKSKVLIEFYNWLLDRYRAGETAVLIVDEAQNLSGELLEEIRMMTNVESSTEKLLQIVLVGQPELERKLKQPQLRQLRQRITLRARTFPLTLGEMKLYVNQRLRIAGSNGQQLFDPASLDAIYRYSNGIPRVVNLICEQCLVSAFVDQQKVVKAAVVEAVARDFDLDDADNLPPAVPLSLDAPANAPASAPFAIPASKIPRQPSAAPASKADLLDAMKTLNDLAERLRNTEPGPPKKRRP
jgi:type II secretory pathway predicted ATPase ExeA